MEHPLISVIMGIYNTAPTLHEAIDCILAQTYENWEFILCDDGSSDNTLEIAKEYARSYPDKFVVLENDENMGLNYTLNRCLSVANARMDGDDVCAPQRFQMQVEFLNANPDYALVSSSMIYFDETGEWGQYNTAEYPTKKDFISSTPFCHAPCMIRKSVFLEVGGYTVAKRFLRVEDLHLWYKIYKKGYKGYNFTQPLYKMRDDHNAFKRRKYRYRINEFYVRIIATFSLHLGLKGVLYSFKPLIVGLLPEKMYLYLHKQKLK